MLETVLTVGLWLLPVLHLVLVLDYGVAFFMRSPSGVRHGMLPATVATHMTVLALRYLAMGRIPLSDPLEILTLVALSTTVVYCLMELANSDRRTGVFVFLVVFMAQYTSSIFLAGSPTAVAQAGPVRVGPWTMHCIAAIFAYTSLALAAVHGALHVIGRRDLQNRRFGLLFDRLPPLEALSRASWHGIAAGLVFMTIAVATGAMFFSGGGGGGMSAKIVIKIAMGLCTWLVCAVGVAGKAVFRWPDSRIAPIAAWGFALIVIMFVVSMALS